MHQFSGTIPGLDKRPSSNAGRAPGPSEAKLIVFQDGGGDLTEAPWYQAWGVGTDTKGGCVLLQKMSPLVVSEPVSKIIISIS